MKENDNRLTSKEVREILKIKSCDLMHLRDDGTLHADKKGNAYLYSEKDVHDYKIHKSTQRT